MNWQALSFVLLALVLVAGFAWYERSRPPSRIVALVAALAALAVAGRVLLAPIPNVVATTDIVLFTGYAVGGAPGFAVGALSAVISNLWLGQGPWTPWQMAGWGLVGLGGAGLAALTGRSLGRVGLALACAIAGLAFGALLDLSVMVTYGGEQSLDRYLALSARGVPFNIAHALGNFALALVAGPALVRMLMRFRSRLEFRWRDTSSPTRAPRRGVGVPAAALLAALALGATLLAGTPQARAAGPGDALAWLTRAQNKDGGFGVSAGASSSPEMTGWAMLGLEAAGRSPLDVKEDGRSPVDYLRKRAGSIDSTGDLERTILALRGAGLDARDFADLDLVKRLLGRRSSDGSFEGQVNLTAFGILALRSANDAGSAITAAAKWLRANQNVDGGWGFQPGTPSDPDSTGAALQALVATGGGDAVKAGVKYLRAAQERDGGWALAGQGAGNSQSTAWAVQGLVAAGVAPDSVLNDDHSGLEFIAARQQSDGHYRYSKSSDQTPVWVTSQALLAVQLEPFPIAPVSTGTGSTATNGSAGSGGSGGAGFIPPGSSGVPTTPGSGAGALGDKFGPGQLPGETGGGVPHGGAVPRGGGAPGSGVEGDPESSDPFVSPESSAPVAEMTDGSVAPFVGVGAAVLGSVAGLGFFWYRGPPL